MDLMVESSQVWERNSGCANAEGWRLHAGKLSAMIEKKRKERRFMETEYTRYFEAGSRGCRCGFGSRRGVGCWGVRRSSGKGGCGCSGAGCGGRDCRRKGRGLRDRCAAICR